MSDAIEAGLLVGMQGQIFSPAGRWETIHEVAFAHLPGGSVRVWTDKTGSCYSWRFSAFQVVRFRAPEIEPTRVLKIFETKEQICAALAQPGEWVWPSDSSVLVAAVLMSGSGGWQLTHRPNGGGEQTERFSRRTLARAAVRRVAKTHAKSIGVRLHDERAIHPTPARMPAGTE